MVFLTEKYRDKINSGDGRDNCKYEFQYAFEQLGSERMIPVVMDPSMKNLAEWTGVLGAAFATGPPCLRGEPYLDLSMDEGDLFNDQCVELARMVQFTMEMVAGQEEDAAAAAAAGGVEGGRSSSFSNIVTSAVEAVGLSAAAVSAVVAPPPPPPPSASTPHRTSRRISQHMQLQQEQQQQRTSFSSTTAGAGAGGELQLVPMDDHDDDNDHEAIFSDVDSDGEEQA